MLPVGPYRTLRSAEGAEFPYYVIPFDKDGTCEGPQTRADLLAHARDFTDIFVFSHGWNNDWTVATTRYEHFINGFIDLRRRHSLPVPSDYKPLLVGIFWPSQALAWFEKEAGPDIAGTDPAAQDAAIADTAATLRDIASVLPPASRARFYELAQAPELNAAQARELAVLLASLARGDNEAGAQAAPTADDLLAAADAFANPEPDWDSVTPVGGAGGADPAQAAGVGDVLKKLDPRNLVKPFTVYQMKDRAGVVGAHGVAPLVADLLNASETGRVHLLGHSFGCKVVMTALCRLPDGLRPVESVLLLQPAVSMYAFADPVPERNVSGGFRLGLKRSRRPIVSTYSLQDSALHDGFHLAVRRHDDLGELQAAGNGPPSKFGALGGFGPLDAGATIEQIRLPVAPYAFGAAGGIIGMESTGFITGHGDISNEATWWLSYSLATAHLRD
jgi:hypothetical protein